MRDAIAVGDRLLIADLQTRYSLARDDGALDLLMECFTHDAVFLRSGREVIGSAAIRDFFGDSMRRYSATTHTVHGAALEATNDADVIAGIVPGHAELVRDGVLCVAAYRYRDTYRRERGHWLIARRELGFLFAMPVDELATGFADARTVRWPGLPPAEPDAPRIV